MRKSQKTAVVAGSVIALLGAGVAFAAWTSNGSDTGAVQAGTAASLTVVAQDDVSGLYPTGSQIIPVHVTNNNPYKVHLDSLTFTGTEGGPCALTVGWQDGNALPDINPGATFDRNLVVSMGADSADGCQGATFTYTFDASAHSVA